MLRTRRDTRRWDFLSIHLKYTCFDHHIPSEILRDLINTVAFLSIRFKICRHCRRLVEKSALVLSMEAPGACAAAYASRADCCLTRSDLGSLPLGSSSP